MPLEHRPEDTHSVEQQLGRTLRGSWAVARRCHLGIPMVIENAPRLEDGSPFPTLYWLTCPLLIKRVSTLEADGQMAAFNQRLGTDEPLRARLGDAIEQLIARRNEHEVIEDAGAPPGGGPDHVKCLHAHAAQELALPPNPIGALSLTMTGWPDCVVPCVTGGRS